MTAQAERDSPHDVRSVYLASYRRLVAQLVGVTGDRSQAEDVVMEAFARAVRSGPEFCRIGNPEAWLRVVAINVARSRYRRESAFRRAAPVLAEPDVSPAQSDLSTDRLALLDALRRLPWDQREAIALHHLADLPVTEVARALGRSENTIKSHLARGRQTLARLLDLTDPGHDLPQKEERHA